MLRPIPYITTLAKTNSVVECIPAWDFTRQCKMNLGVANILVIIGTSNIRIIINRRENSLGEDI